jgi:hypothetical protein
MKITIETIAHKDQRYPTVGDWTFDNLGNLNIRVSALSDWRREALIAIHELVEVILCKQAGVSQEVVDRFDMEFESRQKVTDLPSGNVKFILNPTEGEPGDDPQAPYVRQHCVATGIERLLAAELGVNWKEYEQELDALS